MYFPDLSPYTYRMDHDHSATILNVGWLDGAHPYPTGDVPAVFTERLWAFCQIAVYATFGFHRCDFCPTTAPHPIVVQRGDQRRTLSSAELRVFGHDAILYAAPNLIYHYVTDHHYLPPAPFIEAVLTCPLPTSADYQLRARHYAWGRDIWPTP